MRGFWHVEKSRVRIGEKMRMEKRNEVEKRETGGFGNVVRRGEKRREGKKRR